MKSLSVAESLVLMKNYDVISFSIKENGPIETRNKTVLFYYKLIFNGFSRSQSQNILVNTQ